MEITSIYDIYNKLRKDNISFLYRGAYNNSIAQKIKNFSEFYTEKASLDADFKTKVGSLIIESFKTILQPDSAYNEPYFFSVRSYDANYFFASSQYLSNEHKEFVNERLLQISTLDPKRLKLHFLEIVKEIEQKKIRGLELLGLAQKSGEKPDFSFKQLNEKDVLFSLQVKTRSILDAMVQNNSGPLDFMGFDTEQSVEAPNEPISFTEEMNSLMNDENIQLIFHGDFSQKTILHLMRMIEENLVQVNKDVTKAKEVFLVLIELLQNISKHAEKFLGKKEGIFILSKKNDNFIVSAGNWVYTSTFNKWQSHLENINTLDKNQLNALYLQTMQDGPGSEKGGAGIGLIDVAIMGKGEINYEFIKKDVMYTFFGVSVLI